MKAVSMAVSSVQWLVVKMGHSKADQLAVMLVLLSDFPLVVRKAVDWVAWSADSLALSWVDSMVHQLVAC